jgi:hypothetical protein
MKKLRFLFATIFLVSLAVSINSCEYETPQYTSAGILGELEGASYAITSEGQGGNLNCADLQTYINNLTVLPDVNFYNSVKNNYYETSGTFDGTWPTGLVVNVTADKEVSFTFTSKALCVAAVIVKGSNDANVYYYSEGTQNASGLVSPDNASGKPANLSNLTFCFIECDTEPCWQEETAFGGNTAGAGSAWWFIFDTQGPEIQDIYAGQKKIEGASVEWKEGQLMINLGDNLKLQDPKLVSKLNPKGKLTESWDNEQVKVQGYNDIPSSRPSAGLFTLYKGRNLVINGNGSLYYVIHLDVEVKVECEE